MEPVRWPVHRELAIEEPGANRAGTVGDEAKGDVMQRILAAEPIIPIALSPPFGEIAKGCLTGEHRNRWNAERRNRT
jgi:hypothetical protein